MKDGIITETNAEYHGYKEAISKSRLANMKKCPEYFKFMEEQPEEKTKDLIFGSAFHKVVLEPDDFKSEFAVYPNCDRRTVEGKEIYQEYLKSLNGKQDNITEAEYQTICEMRDKVYSIDLAQKLLNGKREQSFYTTDEVTGEAIKCRPDCYRVTRDKSRVIITDLKSCKTAEAKPFLRDAISYSYDLQAYMYSYVVSRVLKRPIEEIDFFFIACEKKAPYLTNIFYASGEMLERGEALYREYMSYYHKCKQTGNWWGLNGETGEINELILPNYLKVEKEIDTNDTDTDTDTNE